jgi:spore maturation protein CgeB
MPSVLYVGDLGPGLTSQDRADALVGLGAQLDAVGPDPRQGGLGRIDWLLSSRVQISPSIRRLNAAIAERFVRSSYDILWLDKGWMVRPDTLKNVRSKVKAIVLFNNDNPWGAHERGIWRLHKAIVPVVDEVIVPKYSVIRCYEKLGARRVSVADFGFAPARHFAPEAPVARDIDICFIGTALKDGGGIRPDRTEMILQLGKLLPGRISIFGDGWKKALRGAEHYFNDIADGAWDNLYCQTIWRSKINLSFVTKDNWEESSHRAFEITACGGCLLAERSSRLEQSFAEGEEALYFQGASECAEIATKLLDDETRRDRIARAGNRRALGSGYDNQSRLAEAIARSPVLRGHFAEKPGEAQMRQESRNKVAP